MNWARALAFGVAGALLGGAIWVGIGYFTGYELGFLAIGVGAACGVGVAMGANGRAGVEGGILAATLAVFAIVGARYFIVKLALMDMARQAMAESSDFASDAGDDEYWISVIADQLIENMGDDAEYLQWPMDDESLDDDVIANDYPSEIWSQALGTWRGMSASERERFCAVARSEMAREAEGGMEVAAGIVTLISCFRPMSLLFLAMAVGTAFKVAANSRPAGESAGVQNGALAVEDEKLHAMPAWMRAASEPPPDAPAPAAPSPSSGAARHTTHATAPRNDTAPESNSFFIPGLGPAGSKSPDRPGGHAST